MLTVTSKSVLKSWRPDKTDLAFLKEQIDDLERNELDAEDTSVTTFGITRTLSHAREIKVYPDSCCMF